MCLRNLCLLVCLPLFAQTASEFTKEEKIKAGDHTRALIAAAPKLPFIRTELTVQPPIEGWEMGRISCIAVDKKGLIYLLQRGDKADPVIVVDKQGHVLRSWGKGMFKIPHYIRIDPEGNVWTVDAQSSMIYKFTPEGRKLMEISVGEQPAARKGYGAFAGTTDIAFGPNGRLFISDGYGNDRILEYAADGERVHEFATRGIGDGQFQLPHSIQFDSPDKLYVADRENGRIQSFDLRGKHLATWNVGKAYSVKLADGAIWVLLHPVDMPTDSPGWLVKLAKDTGIIGGYLEVPGKASLHSVEITNEGEPLTVVGNHVIWFRKP